MKINNIEVTIKDFERLSNMLTNAIKEIESNNLVYAEQILLIARDSIDKNLIAERNAGQNIKVGDDVEITYLSSDYEEARDKLLGVQCYVESEVLGSYTLQPKKYKDLIVKQWIFNKENLTLI